MLSLWLGFGRGGVGTGGVGTGGIGAGGVGTGGRGAGGVGTRGMDPPPGGRGAGGVGYAGKTSTLASALPRVWVRAALVKASVHGEKVANGDCISRCLEDHCEALENALEQIRITTFRASDLAGS
jgi:hypothetical protein